MGWYLSLVQKGYKKIFIELIYWLQNWSQTIQFGMLDLQWTTYLSTPHTHFMNQIYATELVLTSNMNVCINLVTFAS